MKMRLIVTKYNPEWKTQFQRIRDRIWPSIAAHSLSIEHVGSTSVEGLAAKPIIDIDIVFDGDDKRPAIVKALGTLGYEHLGDLGIEGREAFKCQIPSYAHNLYACQNGSVALKNHLSFRDHLKTSSDDCEKYSKLKISLAEKFSSDIDSYIDGKTAFILNILAQYNFDRNELDQVEHANRK